MKRCPDCQGSVLDVHQEYELEEVSYEHGDAFQYTSKFPSGLPGDVYCQACQQHYWYEELEQKVNMLEDQI